MSDEIDQLRKALFAEWVANHEEHCRNSLPNDPRLWHPGTCYWPMPDLLKGHEEELAEGLP
jgi:hypothetical protein